MTFTRRLTLLAVASLACLSAFAQGDLCRVDRAPSIGKRIRITRASCASDRRTGAHQSFDMPLALGVGQRRIAAAPEPATHDEVASVGRDRVLHAAPVTCAR